MDLIADILLTAGAIGAGIYCFVLGRRLNRFNDLEKGVGGAVAVLSAQVDDLSKTLTSAQQTAAGSAQTLTELTARAEEAARKLELQMAALHDLEGAPKSSAAAPLTAEPTPPPQPAPAREGTPLFARRATPPAAQTGDAA